MENHVYVVQSTATNIEKTNWGGRMDTQTHATPSLSQKPRQSLNIVPSDFGARNNSRKTKSFFFFFFFFLLGCLGCGNGWH
jgi:hypothetical protein